MKILSVVGARPQLIKAAAIGRALRGRHREVLVHTGQHYDANMSDVFFAELGIAPPDHNLNVRSAPHGAQTAAMLEGIERILIDERPDWVIVHGDTNSTLAGALAAAKLHVPVAHVEAGLRSFNRRMPEEINRVVTDHVSRLLLCPGPQAVRNLAAEGLTRDVCDVGDVMRDALEEAAGRAATASAVLERLQLTPGRFLLATVHRAENTDDPERLRAIVGALAGAGERVVFPVHPRTRRILGTALASLPGAMQVIDPVGYLDMLKLEQSARLILTDSGGVQKEAYWLGVPCVTLRDETEWVETVQTGWNVLAGADAGRIATAIATCAAPDQHPVLYGETGAAVRCIEQIERLAR